MENKEYKKLYNYYLDLFNDYCEKVFCSVKSPNRLAEAMKYSLFAGGKRVRPVLMLAFTDILGGDINEVLPFALALECIHTSSLIHDDLPALDNDKLRRGKPTSHVAFDEPTAILAGDALMNFAYEHALENCKSVKMIKAVEYLAKSTGVFGMISGQMTDKVAADAHAFTHDEEGAGILFPDDTLQGIDLKFRQTYAQYTDIIAGVSALSIPEGDAAVQLLANIGGQLAGLVLGVSRSHAV